MVFSPQVVSKFVTDHELLESWVARGAATVVPERRETRAMAAFDVNCILNVMNRLRCLFRLLMEGDYI